MRQLRLARLLRTHAHPRPGVLPFGVVQGPQQPAVRSAAPPPGPPRRLPPDLLRPQDPARAPVPGALAHNSAALRDPVPADLEAVPGPVRRRSEPGARTSTDPSSSTSTTRGSRRARPSCWGGPTSVACVVTDERSIRAYEELGLARRFDVIPQGVDLDAVTDERVDDVRSRHRRPRRHRGRVRRRLAVDGARPRRRQPAVQHRPPPARPLARDPRANPSGSPVAHRSAERARRQVVLGP